MEKYSDDYSVEMEKPQKHSLLFLIFKYLMQVFFGIFAILVFIVVTPLLLIYLFICIVVGKQPVIRLKSLNKNKKN